MVLEPLDRFWFSSPVSALRRATAQTADLLAPTWCVGCRFPGTDLCQDCCEDLRLLTRYPYRAEDPAEALPLLPNLSVLPVFSAGEYSSVVADAVLTFKDHDRVRLSRVLAPALDRAVRAAAELCVCQEILLVWPPSPPRSQLSRGRHPLGELTHQLRLPAAMVPAGHLVRHRLAVADAVAWDRGQKTRSKRARRQRRNRFSLVPGAERMLRGAEVMLVDDVLTTGATLGRLYQRLSQAGAHVSAAAVLAAAPR